MEGSVLTDIRLEKYLLIVCFISHTYTLYDIYTNVNQLIEFIYFNHVDCSRVQLNNAQRYYDYSNIKVLVLQSKSMPSSPPLELSNKKITLILRLVKSKSTTVSN